jgi:hypothetical protein
MVDPNTDVKITGRIEDTGRLMFSTGDVLMEGHTEAGMMIQHVMRTWFYAPYKTGRIRFWFNLPSRGEKLIIDVRGLGRKETIPVQIPVYNGQLHYIEGIPVNEIRVEG